MTRLCTLFNSPVGRDIPPGQFAARPDDVADRALREAIAQVLRDAASIQRAYLVGYGPAAPHALALCLVATSEEPSILAPIHGLMESLLPPSAYLDVHVIGGPDEVALTRLGSAFYARAV